MSFLNWKSFLILSEDKLKKIIMEKGIAYTAGLLIIMVTAWNVNEKLVANRPYWDSKYASEQTREVIGKMIEAHGGLKKWQGMPSISYQHTYVSPHDPSNPWTSDEIVEQGTRRVYQKWPLDNAEIIYDGEAYYGVNWQRGNPPKFTAHLAMYFSNIPWLTQDEGVKLGDVRTRKILDQTRILKMP